MENYLKTKGKELKLTTLGFTLIELLAVIVILAIIALIAVPVIMNVITKARISAFEDSAYGIVKAGELYYSNQLLEPEGMTEDQEFTVVNGIFKNTKSEDTLQISGSLPSSGNVTVTKEGKVALVISNGEFYIQKATTENKVKAKSLKEDGIKVEDLKYKKIANPIFTTSDENASIPACITDNTECSAGTPVAVKVNDTEDPVDFYVMSEDEDKGTITLIMNKNLNDTVAWISKDDYLKAGGTEADWGNNGNNNKGPITALNYLEEQTSSWTNIPEETYILNDDNSTPLYSPMTRTARARLLKNSEATSLLKLSNNSWLYGNLSSSEAPYRYWTSTAHVGHSYYAWDMSYNGYTSVTTIYVKSFGGVRPVITISKSVL